MGSFPVPDPLTPQVPMIVACDGPATGPARGQRPTWLPGAIVILIVLAVAIALITTGHPITDSLLTAGGIALLGGEVARRIVVDAGPIPMVLVTGAVAAFGTLLYVRGETILNVAIGASLAGLVAGEVAARLLGAPRPRWGV